MIVQQGRVITDEAQILPGVIVNSDINASAGIEATKVQTLNLGTNGGVIPSAGIDNADIAANAAIALSKLIAGNQGEVLAYNSSGVLVVLPVGTANQVLTSGGAAADVSWADAGGFVDIAASANLKLSADTENTQSGVGAYAKSKEMVIAHGGTIKVEMDLKHSLGGGIYKTYGRVYVNGAAVGTEHIHSTTSYATYTDASIAVNSGDLVQMYLKDHNAGGHTAYVRNFRLSYDAVAGSGGSVVTD